MIINFNDEEVILMLDNGTKIVLQEEQALILANAILDHFDNYEEEGLYINTNELE